MTFLAGTGIPLPDAVQRPRSRAHPPAGRSRTWARDHRDPQATARDDAHAAQSILKASEERGQQVEILGIRDFDRGA